MFKKIFITIYIYIKSFFGTKVEGTDGGQDSPDISPSLVQRIKKNLWDLYNVDAEDKINYTNTHADHHSNFKHLDDPEDERFDNVTEQVGLKYEEDGNTPLNAAEVFDMSYEDYQTYKKKILPHAKDRKITMEEIQELFD